MWFERRFLSLCSSKVKLENINPNSEKSNYTEELPP